MNKTTTAAAASLALLLALTGCSAARPADTGKTPDTAPVATATPEPEPTPTETVDASEFGDSATSARGNLLKEIGQLAGTSSLTSDTVTARFAVTDIVLDPECNSGFADAPANGHFVGIHLNVETTPELADEPVDWISISSYDWQAYDADGKRLNDPVGNSWSCFDSGASLPMQIGPGQSVSGWIALDVAETSGILALMMPGNSTGWEWAY